MISITSAINTNTKHNRGIRCSGANGLLTSKFGSSTRGERQFLKVFRYHTLLTKPQTLGTSRGVLDLNSSSPVGTQIT